jgi:hypothetical protein
MKSFLLCLVLTAFFTTAHAAPGDDVVVSFYQWYVHALNQDERADPRKSPRIHQYVTERFLQKIAEESKHSGLDGGGLDYDPFLMAQDWDKGWEHNIAVKDLHPEGAKRVVEVTPSGKEMDAHRLILVLAQEAGKWKIDKVDDGDKPVAGR